MIAENDSFYSSFTALENGERLVLNLIRNAKDFNFFCVAMASLLKIPRTNVTRASRASQTSSKNRINECRNEMGKKGRERK